MSFIINEERNLNLSQRSSIHYLLNDIPKKRMKRQEEIIEEDLISTEEEEEMSSYQQNEEKEGSAPLRISNPPVVTYEQSFKIPELLNHVTSIKTSSQVMEHTNQNNGFINHKAPIYHYHHSLPQSYGLNDQVMIKQSSGNKSIEEMNDLNGLNQDQNRFHLSEHPMNQHPIYPSSSSNPFMLSNHPHHYPFVNIQQSQRYDQNQYDYYHHMLNQHYNRKDIYPTTMKQINQSPSSSSIDIHKMPKTIPKIPTPPSNLVPSPHPLVYNPLIDTNIHSSPHLMDRSTTSVGYLAQNASIPANHQQIKRKESKRNKSFYKEVKDILSQSDGPLQSSDDKMKQSLIGFVNDIYFLFNPKLYVGPSNRDGTFEKRVRLHFIDYIEIDHCDPLWICWGTLLDSYGLPIFRRSTEIYRIPGNQSTLFKSNHHLYGWQLASDHQKKLLRDVALEIKKIIEEMIHENNEIHFKEIQNNIQSQFPNKPNQYRVLEDPHENDPKPLNSYSYEYIWNEFVHKDIIHHGKVQMKSSDHHRNLFMNLTHINHHPKRHLFMDILESLDMINTDGYLTEENLRLLYLRFGPFDHCFYDRMIQLVQTECFNCHMNSEKTKELLCEKEIGSYIIRYSNRNPEAFSIAYKDDKGVIIQYYNIKNDIENGSKLNVDSKEFHSWNELIKYFGDLLKFPYLPSKDEKMNRLIGLLKAS